MRLEKKTFALACSIRTVAPKTPTALDGVKWPPLPPTDYCFYPVVNTWTVPVPLDPDRLRKALAKALSVYSINAARLGINPRTSTWQLNFVNQAVPLTIGTSSRPGPFAVDWNGKKIQNGAPIHQDYYDEVYPAGATPDEYAANPLMKLKVTTWTETGQTSIMLSQSYHLGWAAAA
ncbi:hypothetical protein VTN00DRAFT_10142 [Thermoascus crustaceus]|uniref:uncharacterized protein n=1 Tax=Thermoascus crustaceus TaxID=5088 RepID=UPI003742FFF3